MKKLIGWLLGSGCAFLALYLLLIFNVRSAWAALPLAASIRCNVSGVHLLLTLRARDRQGGHDDEA